MGGIENYTDASSGTVKVNSEIRMQGQGSVQFDYTINASTRKRVSVGPTFESMWYLPNGRLDMYDTLTVYIKNPDNRKKNVSLVAKHTDSGKLLHIAAADGTNTVSVGYKTDFTGYVFDLSKVTDDEGNPIDKDWFSGISGFQFLFNLSLIHISLILLTDLYISSTAATLKKPHITARSANPSAVLPAAEK